MPPASFTIAATRDYCPLPMTIMPHRHHRRTSWPAGWLPARGARPAAGRPSRPRRPAHRRLAAAKPAAARTQGRLLARRRPLLAALPQLRGQFGGGDLAGGALGALVVELAAVLRHVR